MSHAVVAFFFFISFFINQGHVNADRPDYCSPANSSCWPTTSQVSALNHSLLGQLYDASSDPRMYDPLIKTFNLRWMNQFPAWVIAVQDTSDVQAGVTFASDHKIQLAISSTGHSFSGRNTANNSLMINQMSRKAYSISDDKSTITVQPGLRWGEIHAIANASQKIVVGGGDPDVSVYALTLQLSTPSQSMPYASAFFVLYIFI